MPNKNFLKLAGLVVLIFFLISFFAFGTSSCEATKKALQSRVDAVKAASETGKDIPADTSSASSSSSTDKATSDTNYSDSASESSDTLGDSGEPIQTRKIIALAQLMQATAPVLLILQDRGNYFLRELRNSKKAITWRQNIILTRLKILTKYFRTI